MWNKNRDQREGERNQLNQALGQQQVQQGQAAPMMGGSQIKTFAPPAANQTSQMISNKVQQPIGINIQQREISDQNRNALAGAGLAPPPGSQQQYLYQPPPPPKVDDYAAQQQGRQQNQYQQPAQQQQPINQRQQDIDRFVSDNRGLNIGGGNPAAQRQGQNQQQQQQYEMPANSRQAEKDRFQNQQYNLNIGGGNDQQQRNQRINQQNQIRDQDNQVNQQEQIPLYKKKPSEMSDKEYEIYEKQRIRSQWPGIIQAALYAKNPATFDVNLAKELAANDKEFAVLYKNEEAKKKKLDDDARLEQERKDRVEIDNRAAAERDKIAHDEELRRAKFGKPAGQAPAGQGDVRVEELNVPPQHEQTTQLQELYPQQSQYGAPQQPFNQPPQQYGAPQYGAPQYGQPMYNSGGPGYYPPTQPPPPQFERPIDEFNGYQQKYGGGVNQTAIGGNLQQNANKLYGEIDDLKRELRQTQLQLRQFELDKQTLEKKVLSLTEERDRERQERIDVERQLVALQRQMQGMSTQGSNPNLVQQPQQVQPYGGYQQQAPFQPPKPVVYQHAQAPKQLPLVGSSGPNPTNIYSQVQQNQFTPQQQLQQVAKPGNFVDGLLNQALQQVDQYDVSMETIKRVKKEQFGMETTIQKLPNSSKAAGAPGSRPFSQNQCYVQSSAIVNNQNTIRDVDSSQLKPDYDAFQGTLPNGNLATADYEQQPNFMPSGIEFGGLPGAKFQ